MLHQILAALIAFITPLLIAQPHPTPSAAVEVVAQNLEIPWELAFLPNGDALVTERPGRLQLLDRTDKLHLIAILGEVKPSGEGGLLGVAVDPNYITNKYIYLYFTYQADANLTRNRVVRYVFDSQVLKDPTTIVDNIPGSSHHNGGRLKFGPDGYLYITTGDAENPSQAQDNHSLAGKILRWKDSHVEVYSSGHRNPQGLAWDSSGQLWETEHGPTAHDEVNKITRGQNYGWPIITGNQTRAGLVTPVAQSGDQTWAPSGLAYIKDSLYFTGLRGEALFVISDLNNPSGVQELFKNQYGRLRDVELGPDEQLYLLTSNRDGRGTVHTGDDKIIKLDLTKI